MGGAQLKGLYSCTFLQQRFHKKKKKCVQFFKFKYAQSKGCSDRKRPRCSTEHSWRISFPGSELHAFQIMELFNTQTQFS